MLQRQSAAFVHPVPSLLPHSVVVAPAGQLVQLADPVAGLNLPTSQVVHVSSGFDIVPVAPAMQVQSVTAFDAVLVVLERDGHAIQLAAAVVSAYLPASQAVHVSVGFVSEPKYPNPQAHAVMAVDATAVVDAKVGHDVHIAVAFVPSSYWPIGHALHLSVAVVMIPECPALHRQSSISADPVVFVLESVGHTAHGLTSVTCLYLPTKQALHLSDEAVIVPS